MTQNFSMPTVVFSVNSIQDKSVINNDGTKVFFSLTVIESLSVLSDLIQQSLPFINVIS